jgi:hypothetical protein
MYTWLSKEIQTVKTPQFHLIQVTELEGVNNPIDWSLLPLSYTTYIDQFGRSKLYRSGNGYLIEILATPYRELELDGHVYVRFGIVGFTTMACFRLDQLSTGIEAPVYELEYWDSEYEVEQTFPGFDVWLVHNSNAVKENMDEGDWDRLIKGPSAFNDKEKIIVNERKNFKFSLVGFTNTGDANILVQNQSQLTLPYLTIGVKWKDTNHSIQKIWLPTDGLQPGESRVVSHEVYKKFIPRESIELRILPDPQPEDREVYWEFKSSSD